MKIEPKHKIIRGTDICQGFSCELTKLLCGAFVGTIKVKSNNLIE